MKAVQFVTCWFVFLLQPENDVFKEWMRVKTFDDRVSLTGLITSKRTKLVSQCLLECAQVDACVMVGCSESLMICDLYSDVLTENSVFTYQDSTAFYIPTSMADLLVPTCTDSAYTYVDHLKICLRIVNNGATFTTARSDCQSDGGDLISAKTFAIIHYLRDNVIAGGRYWIGLTQTPGDLYSWYWVDNSQLTIDLWATNEPNGVPEECAELRFDADGNFVGNDHDCGRVKYYICQKT